MYKQQSLNIADWFMLADIELENSTGVLVLNANYFLQLITVKVIVNGIVSFLKCVSCFCFW